MFSLPKFARKDWENGILELIELLKNSKTKIKLKDIKLQIKKNSKNLYYIVIHMANMFHDWIFEHDIIVNLLLGITVEHYTKIGLEHNGFIKQENNQVYFNDYHDANGMLAELECYLVMNKLVGD